MSCCHSSLWSRSKDKIEVESLGLAGEEKAEQRPREYSAELEALCEELRATLAGLVRPGPSHMLAAGRWACLGVPGSRDAEGGFPAPVGFSLPSLLSVSLPLLSRESHHPKTLSSTFVLWVLCAVRCQATPTQGPQRLLSPLSSSGSQWL